MSFSSSVQFSSIAQSCPTLCDSMNRSTPGLPVYHQLLEFTQTHVHWVGDAIQPSYPLSSPSPPAPNPSQHQGPFQWVNSAWGGQSIGVSALASVLPNTQDWSLEWNGWISLQSKGLSRVPLKANSWLTLCNTMDCSLSVYSVHRFLQARILKWVAISSFSNTRDQKHQFFGAQLSL